MSNKKSSKKEQQKLAQIERNEAEQKHEQQRKMKQQKNIALAKKSVPLIDYQLIDAYQYFLLELAKGGIPQVNVFEFAAQAVLKFEKNKIKRDEKLRHVEMVNQMAVKHVAQISSKGKKSPQKQRKPQLLPFKGQISADDLKILNKM